MAEKEKTEKSCKDKKCPIHGSYKPRGRIFEGVVVSVNPHKTAVVEWEWQRYIPKYERYERKKTKISAHNPDCVYAKKGDKVMIQECRPISKTKNFTILKIIGKEELFAERERLMEEAKVRKPKEEGKEKLAEKEKREAEK